MMKSLNKYLYIALVLFIGTACEPDLSDLLVKADNGNDAAGALDMSKYVAVGNSLTAGYADGALYAEAQSQSFPSILASRFEAIGGGAFTQPVLDDPGFGIDASGPVGYFHITSVDASTTPPTVNFSRNTEVNNTALLTKASGSDFNNLGVPGIRVFDVTLQGYGLGITSPTPGNPYFFRMIPDTDPLKTYLEVVAESDPTFFTCWLGNNDVLGYATSGGAAGVNGADALYTGGITPTALFEANYNAIISALTQEGASGVVINIPNVTDIPYFTTVPQQIIPLDATAATQLNTAYADFNTLVTLWNANILGGADGENGRPTIEFAAGNNYPIIVDESLPDAEVAGNVIPKIRQLEAGEYLLLPFGSAIVADPTLGTQTAIPSQYTLTATELGHISNAIAAYNLTIRNVALNNPNIVLWDANSFFSEFVEDGYQEGSITMSEDFIAGGAFSLDGVHPTPRGYALIANQIMSTINNHFGVSILPVKMQDYRTVKLESN